jgi:hypothetical protein
MHKNHNGVFAQNAVPVVGDSSLPLQFIDRNVMLHLLDGRNYFATNNNINIDSNRT